MSSKTVRDDFRASWTTLVPSVPFYETINDDPDHTTMPDIWATGEFVAFNEDQVALGNPSCRRETGTIIVVVSGKAGEGDSDLNTAVETIRTAYRHWASSNGVKVTQIDPPLSDDGFSSGRFYTMSVDISYVFDQVI